MRWGPCGLEIFNRSRRNHLFLSRTVHNVIWDRTVGWWLNGRIAGRYVSLYLPFRRAGREE